jgi:hypothetical protein
MSNPQVPVSGSVGAAGPFPTLGATVITLLDADHVLLDPSETCYQYILVKGTLTAIRTITAPNNAPGFTYIVINETTGGFSINFGGSSGDGVTIQNGAGVLVTTDGTNYTSPTGGSGGAGFSLGMSAVGNSLFVEAGTDWTNCSAGGTTTIFTLPPFVADNGEAVAGSSNLSSAEQVTIAALIDVQNPENDDFAHFEWRMSGRGNGTTVLNTQGTTAPTEITTPPEPLNEGASLVGMTATIVIVGQTITVQVTTLASVPVLAAVSVSYVRRSPGAAPPAPAFTGITVNTGPAEGGTAFSTIGGANLQYVFGVHIVLPGPTVVPASFTYNAITGELDIISGVSSVGGVGNVELLSPGGTATLVGAWTYDLDSFVIFGPNAHVWKMSGVTEVGGDVTAWEDQNRTTPADLTVTGTLTYNAADTSWTPTQPSVGFGGASYAATGVINASSDATLFVWAICKPTDSSTNRVMIVAESPGFVALYNLSGNAAALSNGREAVDSVPINNLAALYWANAQDSSYGPGGLVSVSVDGDTPTTNAGTGQSVASTIGVQLGTYAGSAIFVGQAVEFGFCWFPSGTSPTPTQLTQLHAYAHTTYGVT